MRRVRWFDLLASAPLAAWRWAWDWLIALGVGFVIVWLIVGVLGLVGFGFEYTMRTMRDSDPGPPILRPWGRSWSCSRDGSTGC
jgi:hypothetical protein